jgi:hypothetical protein
MEIVLEDLDLAGACLHLGQTEYYPRFRVNDNTFKIVGFAAQRWNREMSYKMSANMVL